jgi:transposase
VRAFYSSLTAPALVGIESPGHTLWFAEMLSELGHERGVRNAAKIRASKTRAQKDDGRDAWRRMELRAEGKFPRIWLPSDGERDARVLLNHRHSRVEMRTRVKNGLQALALSRNLRPGRQRLGAIRQQGNPFVRALLVQAAHVAVRHDPHIAPAVPSAGAAEEPRSGHGGHRAQVGGRVVLDPALGVQDSEVVGSMQGSPSHSVAETPRPTP